MSSIERSALQATVGGRAFEKSCGRERCARRSQTSSEAATYPPAAPPSALPSVPVITSTSPRSPKCSTVPRPVSPSTPTPCESSTIDDRVVLARELDDLRELREIALHREDAVGDDQLARVARSSRERVAQRLHVRVRVDDLRRRPREPDRVDDARVVELVGEDHRRLVGEARDARLVRVPARDVGERRLGAGEVGERALELEVRLEGPADEAHRRRPGAVALEPLDPRAHDLGVPGEAEVVVRGEDDHLAASRHPHDRPLRRLERQEALVRPRVAEPVELGAELLVERGGHGVAPFGRRTILQASPDSSSANASS